MRETDLPDGSECAAHLRGPPNSACTGAARGGFFGAVLLLVWLRHQRAAPVTLTLGVYQ